VVHPAAADHRRHDAHVRQLVGRDRHRIAVEHDDVREVAGKESSPPSLVAG